MGAPQLEFPDRYNAATDFLDSNLEAGRAAKVALRTEGGDVTYGQVAGMANRLGNALRELGIEQEHRVLMALLDTPEFPATFFGAIKIGALPIPVNTNLKAQDYAYFLNDSRARAAVVSPPLVDLFRQVRGDLKHLKHLIVAGQPGPGELSYAEITATASDRLSPADTGKDDMAFWLYSSGTTGFPKGVVHLQHDMRVCTELYAKGVLGISESDVCFSVAKLYFAYGLGNSLYFPFAVGATSVLLPGPPAPATVVGLVRRFKPTLYFAVPTSYANSLAADPEIWNQADFSSVRTFVSAGEPLSGALLERWKAKTGKEILDGIGTTEICHIFISNRPGQVRPDSSGTVVPGYEAKVVDLEGAVVPDGKVGTLMVKGDSIFAFYWNKHERTKKTLIGDWINTGDQYSRDADGTLRYQGRADDMLKVGAIWVSPIEVETVVNAHDAVLECAVVGIADENQLVHAEAFVVLQPGRTAGLELEESLRAHVRERLAHFKCPRDFHFVDALPKTATGKIQRYKFREAGAPERAPA